MTIKRFGVLALVFLVLFLAACSGTEEPTYTPVPTPTATPTATPTPEPTPEPTPDVWTGPRNPLTGEPVEEDISEQRPFAILLNNLQLALPQDGLSRADIIYELPVEGGITRILAVFQDIEDVGVIGPVRSVRDYFVDIVQAHDAIFVFAGGSPAGYEAARSRGVPHIDGVLGAGREFFRDQARANRAGFEHSLMTSSELLLANIGSYNFRMEHQDGFDAGLVFAYDAAPVDGQAAHEVTVRFSNVKTGIFTFDEETGLYRVSQFSNPHIDGATGEQLQVRNVLVLYATFWVADNYGRLGVNLTLGGEGYFISGGYMVPIRWTKGSHSEPFRYTLLDGTPLELAVGQTYVNIVNVVTGEVTIT
ncbi:MAG: DUF3048 domain-containing protein [Oscillospiraceae bacterium]|nr:DUF3048 domain-containing protein [Oscillospiraceae bacterium]